MRRKLLITVFRGTKIRTIFVIRHIFHELLSANLFFCSIYLSAKQKYVIELSNENEKNEAFAPFFFLIHKSPVSEVGVSAIRVLVGAAGVVLRISILHVGRDGGVGVDGGDNGSGSAARLLLGSASG